MRKLGPDTKRQLIAFRVRPQVLNWLVSLKADDESVGQYLEKILEAKMEAERLRSEQASSLSLKEALVAAIEHLES